MTPTLRLGLLGHPVGHSVSPAIHGAALDALGLAGSYAAFDVPPAELAERVDDLRAGRVDGYNVTIPHKVAVAALCDRLAGAAALLGSVNTLCRAEDGAVEGHNTDLPGLVAAIRSAWPVRSWSGRIGVVLGAGGAARSAVAAASELGCAEVRVVNRTHERAEILAEVMGGALACAVSVRNWEPGALAGASLVVQATSAGMSTTPGSEPWTTERARARSILADVEPDGALMDLVYRPAETPWVAAAGQLGLATAGGLEMLIRQAALSFERWTGRAAPLQAMRKAAHAGV